MTAVWLLSCEWRKRSLDIDAIRTIPQTRVHSCACLIRIFLTCACFTSLLKRLVFREYIKGRMERVRNDQMFKDKIDN